MNGIQMEVMGQGCVKEIFIIGMEKLALYVTLDEPVVEEIEPPSKEVMIEDLSKGNLLITEGRPTLLDDEQYLEHRLKRSREGEDDVEGPNLYAHKEKHWLERFWRLCWTL